MAISSIPVFTGTSPDRNQQSAPVFTANAIEWLDYQLIQIDATNATVEGINLAVIAFDAGVLAAAASAAESASSADDSSTSATVSQSNANFKGRWSDATGAATIPATYSNNSQTWQLLQDIADITADEPLPGAANWQVVNDINMSNVNVSELDNPTAHLLKKNKFVETLKGNVSVTRNTISTRVGINGIVRAVEIDEPREEETGWLFEGSSVNEAIHKRDFTNAAWVKTNLTALKDAIGHDNIANAASTLTATSANGTAFQTVTKSSAENTYSIDIRRKTGTGAIEITDDGGSTFTDVTSLINSLTYKRFQITTTQANPEFGVRIVTSGDEVEVDYSGLEELEFASSRMDDPALPAATTSRSADDQSFPSAENFRESEGAIFLKVDIIGDTGATQAILDITDGTASNRIALTRTSDKIRLEIRTGGVLQSLVGTSFNMEVGQQYEIGLNYKDDAVELFVDSVSIGADTSVTMPTGLTIVNVGEFFTAGTNGLFGHIQDLRFYPKRRTLDEIKYLGGM